MHRSLFASATIALAAIIGTISGTIPVQAQQAAQPTFATTKIADNVYMFRYQGHQAMFVVTPQGVIATDLISEGALALEMHAFLEDMSLTIHPHPTLSEAVGESMLALAGKPLHTL